MTGHPQPVGSSEDHTRKSSPNRSLSAARETAQSDNETFQGRSRVSIADLHKGAFNPDIDLWIQTKYTALGDPVRLASYREAQLILAEAKAMQGDFSGAMDVLNARRTQLSLPPLSATDQTSAVNNVIEERRRELVFEGGHRLNDLLRKSIPWKVSGTKNPFTGRPYGATTCWPTPTKEINGN